MELKRMYAPQKDSPTTFLLGAINSTDTFVIVGNAQLLPSVVPFPLTLGPDKTVTETVMVTQVNLGNNRIIFERGPGALPWPSGTTVARTFNADDLQSVQENIVGINSEVETSKSNISSLTSTVGGLNTVVGNAGSGLVKGLADEITRATGAEAAETLRATTAENALNSSKINRSELPQILIDTSYSADATKLTTTLSRYNASNQQSGSYSRILPLVSSSTVGIMTPEAYNEIASLRNDVSALQQQGGKFIGLSFATKSALNSYIVPSSVKAGDFTYVIDDETKDDSTTRYVFNGATFDFAFVVNYDPVGIANTGTPGIVKSSASNSTGKIFVEMDGTMSLVGWDDYTSSINSAIGTKAPLASPALTGTPTAPTATAGTNTTQVATTAFVNTEISTDRPYASTTTSLTNGGTGTVGTSPKVARADHTHTLPESVLQTQVINNLITGGATNVLSAEQGKVLSLAIGQKADKTQISNPNLLINGDFQVWQRGDGSKTVIGTGPNQYTADRWIFASINPVKCNYAGSDYDGPIRFYSDGTIAPSNTRFEQFLPLSPNMRRQLYTFSAKARCTGVASRRIGMSLRNKDTGEIYAKGEFVVTPDNWKLIHLPPVWVEKCDILEVSFGICTNTSDYHGLTSPQGLNPGENIDILYAKLEYGELPTMFVSKSYAEELAMCQRYYQDIPRIRIKVSTASSLDLKIPYSLPVVMRFAPTISYTGGDSVAFIESDYCGNQILLSSITNNTTVDRTFTNVKLDAEIY